MVFQGYDGEKYLNSSAIAAIVDDEVNTNSVPGGLAFLVADSSGVIDASKGIFLKSSQNVGIMTSSPTKTLDVNGDAIIRGDLNIDQGLFNLSTFTSIERDNLSPQNGSIIYNTTTNKFQGFADGFWIDLH